MSFMKPSSISLQTTISAATASNHEGVAQILPHHPITCTAELFFDEEGCMYCTHAKAPQGDARTQASLNHSMAILILELASKL